MPRCEENTASGDLRQEENSPLSFSLWPRAWPHIKVFPGRESTLQITLWQGWRQRNLHNVSNLCQKYSGTRRDRICVQLVPEESDGGESSQRDETLEDYSTVMWCHSSCAIKRLSNIHVALLGYLHYCPVLLICNIHLTVFLHPTPKQTSCSCKTKLYKYLAINVILIYTGCRDYRNKAI